MDRRTLLGTAAGLGIAGLAGCATLADASVSPPNVPEDDLKSKGWTQVDSTQDTILEESYGPVTLTAKAYTVIYSNTALRERVKEDSLGKVDSRLALFSATRIDFSPDLGDLPGGVGRKEVMDKIEENARDRFRSRLKDAGLEEVTRTDTGSFDVNTGESASLTEYEATYDVPTFDFAIDANNTVSIEGQSLTVNGALAVWHHGDFSIVAGGAYLGENFTKSTTKHPSDAITVSVDVDLGFEPETYRENVHGFIKQTS